MKRISLNSSWGVPQGRCTYSGERGSTALHTEPRFWNVSVFGSLAFSSFQKNWATRHERTGSTRIPLRLKCTQQQDRTRVQRINPEASPPVLPQDSSKPTYIPFRPRPNTCLLCDVLLYDKQCGMSFLRGPAHSSLQHLHNGVESNATTGCALKPDVSARVAPICSTADSCCLSH